VSYTEWRHKELMKKGWKGER